MPGEWMNSPEVADLLGITPRTLDNWCSEGRIKFYKPGRRRRFRRSEVLYFIERSAVNTEAGAA